MNAKAQAQQDRLDVAVSAWESRLATDWDVLGDRRERAQGGLEAIAEHRLQSPDCYGRVIRDAERRLCCKACGSYLERGRWRKRAARVA